jgi:hypothetical protein
LGSLQIYRDGTIYPLPHGFQLLEESADECIVFFLLISLFVVRTFFSLYIASDVVNQSPRLTILIIITFDDLDDTFHRRRFAWCSQRESNLTYGCTRRKFDRHTRGCPRSGISVRIRSDRKFAG